MVLLFAACAVTLALLACGGEGGRSRAGETAAPTTPAPGAQSSGVGSLMPDSAGGVDANGELLLDDLSDGNAKFSAAGVSGEWFTYADGTAVVTPPDHTGLLVSGGETPARPRSSISGSSAWRSNPAVS